MVAEWENQRYREKISIESMFSSRSTYPVRTLGTMYISQVHAEKCGVCARMSAALASISVLSPRGGTRREGGAARWLWRKEGERENPVF